MPVLRQINTVGDLRALLKDLPDQMEILPELGPDIDDIILDATGNGLDQSTIYFTAAVETRCDDTAHLFVMINGQLDEKEEEETEPNPMRP